MSVSTVKAGMPSSSRLVGRKCLAGVIVVGALFAAASASNAQTSLKAYTDAKGYIDVRALTCAQLAGTFQEDANFLGVWYAGWYNGRAKLHSINVVRTEAGIHHVIVYCKANPDKKVTEAIEVLLKGDK